MLIHRDKTHPAFADTQQFHSFVITAVGLRGGVNRQLARRTDQALGAHIVARFDLPGNRQADEISHRTTAEQNAAGIRRKTGDLLTPIDNLALHIIGDMFSTAHIRINDGGQVICQGGIGNAIAHHPAPETRVQVAHLVGQDVLLEFLVSLVFANRFVRHFLVEKFGSFFRHGPPDGAIA